MFTLKESSMVAIPKSSCFPTTVGTSMVAHTAYFLHTRTTTPRLDVPKVTRALLPNSHKYTNGCGTHPIVPTSFEHCVPRYGREDCAPDPIDLSNTQGVLSLAFYPYPYHTTIYYRILWDWPSHRIPVSSNSGRIVGQIVFSSPPTVSMHS